MSTQLQGLLKRLDEIVDGIDRDESDGGWWETEKGVELGKTTLRELRQLVTEAAQSAEACAALADEPAVPKGREPTRDELWELWLRLNNELPDRPAAVAEFWEHAQIDARARWGKPTPVPPADGEVAELMEGLRLISDGMSAIGHDSDSWFVARAAKLLQRQALVPVSVSERLPGLEDCDAEGRCWFLRFPFDYSRESWSLETRTYGCNIGFTHWLPAHALPIPHQQENAND